MRPGAAGHAIVASTDTAEYQRLVDVLKAGMIRGAGIDVLDQEPPPADHPLFALPNVLLSPHVAGVTENGMKDMALNCAQVVETFVAGGQPAKKKKKALAGAR